MSSAFRDLGLAVLLAAAAGTAGARELRVCADPDNLPYSRRDGSGFENRIAELVAAELGAELRYQWAPMLRGFVRKNIGEGLCEVFIGVPTGFERLLTTRPYYRSSYVSVARAATRVPALDDPRIRALRVGVQLPGDDLAATPPGHALASQGAVDNVTGFAIMGEEPAAQRMVRAVAEGRLDAALVWGPQAGWFAARATPPLAVSVTPPPAGFAMPFEFSISMGVKRGNRALRDELDGVIERRRADIDAILASYAVPRTDPAGRLAGSPR